MYTFACKTLGLDCDFVASGPTKEEVKQKAMEHGKIAHADMMRGMTAEQSAEFAKTLDGAIQTA